MLPWRDAGDMFAAEGPFPSWYPEYLIDRDGERELTRFFDTRESRREDVAFVVTASELCQTPWVHSSRFMQHLTQVEQSRSMILSVFLRRRALRVIDAPSGTLYVASTSRRVPH